MVPLPEPLEAGFHDLLKRVCLDLRVLVLQLLDLMAQFSEERFDLGKLSDIASFEKDFQLYLPRFSISSTRLRTASPSGYSDT